MSHDTRQAVIYKVYTEDTAFRPRIVELISKYFDGFTMTSGSGFWKGLGELSLTIEIIGVYADKSKVLKLAAEIKILNKQESVLVFTGTGLVNEIN